MQFNSLILSLPHISLNRLQLEYELKNWILEIIVRLHANIFVKSSLSVL